MTEESEWGEPWSLRTGSEDVGPDDAWFYAEIIDSDGDSVGVRVSRDDSDLLDHIVRCVNLHEELVKALEWSLPRVGDTSYEDLKNPEKHRTEYQRVRALLAKAKGET